MDLEPKKSVFENGSTSSYLDDLHFSHLLNGNNELTLKDVVNIKGDNESALKLLRCVYIEVFIRSNRKFDLLINYKSNSF